MVVAADFCGPREAGGWSGLATACPPAFGPSALSCSGNAQQSQAELQVLRQQQQLLVHTIEVLKVAAARAFAPPVESNACDPFQVTFSDGGLYGASCNYAVGFHGIQGRQPKCEDYVMHLALGPSLFAPFNDCSRACFACVLDGHGGTGAVQYVAERLPAHLLNDLLRLRADPAAAMRAAMHRVDEELTSLGHNSGTTVNAVLVVDSTVTVVNTGDCRCILFDWIEERAVQVTNDHNLLCTRERERVLGAGAELSGCGSYVVLPCPADGAKLLGVTKALGHGDVKSFQRSATLSSLCSGGGGGDLASPVSLGGGARSALLSQQSQQQLGGGGAKGAIGCGQVSVGGVGEASLASSISAGAKGPSPPRSASVTFSLSGGGAPEALVAAASGAGVASRSVGDLAGAAAAAAAAAAAGAPRIPGREAAAASSCFSGPAAAAAAEAASALGSPRGSGGGGAGAGGAPASQLSGAGSSGFVLTCEPDVFQFTVEDDRHMLLLGCDGVFDSMSNAEACRTALRQLTATNSCADAAREVAHRACRLGSLDNITCAVVRFGRKPVKRKQSFSVLSLRRSSSNTSGDLAASGGSQTLPSPLGGVSPAAPAPPAAAATNTAGRTQ